ncbi:MAG: ABC transporter permease [Thaumarchaeota archaeon]|nr:ABC transporter permease [Nitrososphaerota archaeon]
MNPRAIAVVTFHTFKDAARTKWLWVFAATFFLLALNLPILVLLTFRYLPPNYLDIYLSALVTLSFPFLPLLSLPIGALAVVEERESGILSHMLSTPMSKSDLLLGKLFGLLLATTAVVMLGYGAAAGLTFTTRVSRYGDVLDVGFAAAFLNAIMVCLSLLISVLARRKATALGVAIFFWFFFSVFTNLGLLTVILNLTVGPAATVQVLFVDPVELARLMAVIILGTGDQLGSTGLTWVHVYGASAVPAILAVMTVWFVGLFAGAVLIFRRQDVV